MIALADMKNEEDPEFVERPIQQNENGLLHSVNLIDKWRKKNRLSAPYSILVLIKDRDRSCHEVKAKTV